jgi:hypothetical protein
MMTPAQFATEIVVPTVREFRENRRSRRHAYLACFAAYHLKDYLKKAGADAEFAMKLHGGSRCFEAVRAVCIAAKHVEFAGARSEHISFKSGEDYDRPPAVWDQLQWDLSRWGDEHGGREIAPELGGLDLYESVKTVLRAYDFHFEFLFADVDFSDC